jgi:bla regulator protein blaR1
MNADRLTDLSQATVAISLAIVLILALRRPLRAWLGARAAYFLWLLVPMTVVAVLLPAPAHEAHLVSAATAVIGMPQQMTGAIVPGEGSSLPAWLLSAWLLGVGVALWLFARRQARFNRSVVRQARAPYDQVIDHGPAVFGVFRPRIVLPADFQTRYSADEQTLVIAHEQAHVRRGDVQAQALAVGLRCVFWFNPLVHFAAGRFRFDQELACDATVLANFPAARRTYGDAMLKTQLAELGLPIGCTWQSSHSLKERITMLKSSVPSTSRRLLAQSGLVAGCLFAACAVWATQTPAPAVTASARAQTFDSRFDIRVDGVASGKPRMLSKAGEAAAFSVKQPSGTWQVSLGYRAIDGNKIDVSGVISHDGVVISRPRLTVEAGVESGIGVSTLDGKSLLEFKLVVSQFDGKMPSPGETPMPTLTTITARDQLAAPAYPVEAKGISGKIVLNVLVGADGAVKDVKVESASPSHVFDASAIKAAYSWKFTPASRQSDGKKVEGWVRVPVTFEADKTPAPKTAS